MVNFTKGNTNPSLSHGLNSIVSLIKLHIFSDVSVHESNVFAALGRFSYNTPEADDDRVRAHRAPRRAAPSSAQHERHERHAESQGAHPLQHHPRPRELCMRWTNTSPGVDQQSRSCQRL